jgi:hypothetical protein
MSFGDIEFRCDVCEQPGAKISRCCFEAALRVWQHEQDEKKAAEAKAERERAEKERAALIEHHRQNIRAWCLYCGTSFWECDAGNRKYHCGTVLDRTGVMIKVCSNTPPEKQSPIGAFPGAPPDLTSPAKSA